jgi:hypothetical protein
VLYNVADALAEEGAPVLDVAPFVEGAIRHRGVAAARRVWLLLLCIEWQPVVMLRERRGFSWLPRERRRALLRGWERSCLGPRRRAFTELRGWIEAASTQSSGA